MAALPACSATAMKLAKEASVRHRTKARPFSLNDDFATRVAALPPGLLQQAGVVYLAPLVAPASLTRLLTDIPAVATGGDAYIALQNGCEEKHSSGTQVPSLITYKERRVSRKKAIITYDLAGYKGGYHSHPTPLDPPRHVACVSVAGPQFEMEYLEAVDFCCLPPRLREVEAAVEAEAEASGIGGAMPLFPHYYSDDSTESSSSSCWRITGRKPTWEEADALAAAAAGGDAEAAAEMKRLDLVAIPGTAASERFGGGGGLAGLLRGMSGKGGEAAAAAAALAAPGAGPAYLCGAAYTRSCLEDLHLILGGVDAWVERLAAAAAAVSPGSEDASWASSVAPRRLWLQLPMIGMGFFARLLCRWSITDLLLPRFVAALRTYLSSRSSPFRHLAVLELCDFTRDGSFSVGGGAKTQLGGITVVHSTSRSLLDFSAADAAAEAEGAPYTLAVVNAGDVFAFTGNERGYCSVEAMLGENMSIRRTGVYVSNPWLLDEAAHIPLAGEW